MPKLVCQTPLALDPPMVGTEFQKLKKKKIICNWAKHWDEALAVMVNVSAVTAFIFPARLAVLVARLHVNRKRLDGAKLDGA